MLRRVDDPESRKSLKTLDPGPFDMLTALSKVERLRRDDAITIFVPFFKDLVTLKSPAAEF